MKMPLTAMNLDAIDDVSDAADERLVAGAVEEDLAAQLRAGQPASTQVRMPPFCNITNTNTRFSHN